MGTRSGLFATQVILKCLVVVGFTMLPLGIRDIGAYLALKGAARPEPFLIKLRVTLRHYPVVSTKKPEAYCALRCGGLRLRLISPMVSQCGIKVPQSTLPQLTLVLGGARSGKSRYAESLIAALPPPWIFVATAEAGDAEMAERISLHRARRGKDWLTIEAPHDLAAALVEVDSNAPAVVDCLTLWLSNRMLAGADVEAETMHLEAALAGRGAPVILVSNEVGLSIVPDNALARRFRDLQGRLNQRMAARAGRVVLMVAGLPLVAKDAT
jgi:adenosylcobinamide kinase / adenosylcobinamide-phosphate guanylyltransferase